jgi:hypothetical protein
LDDLGINGSIILKQILNKEDGNAWTGVIWLMIDTSGDGSL